MSKLSESTDDLSCQLFKSVKSRARYRKFVRVTEIRSQPTKHQANDTDGQKITKIALCECLTCGKMISTHLGATSNILRHFKMIHGINIKVDDNQRDEAEEEPIPKRRFNRPNTMFVKSNVVSKILPAKKPQIEKLCRLCARRSETLQPIFRMYNGRLLNDLISTLCPIQIEPGDSLPKQICDECLEIVVSANGLRETSLQSDIKFRSGNLPEEPIQVKEDELQSEDEPMIDYPMSSSSQTFFDDSVWHCDETRRFDYPTNDILTTSGNAFECDLCSKKFTQKTSIERHMKSEHFRDQKISANYRISCPLNCGVTFSLLQSVKRHIKHIHKADDETCNRILNSKSAPAQPIQDLPFCHICGQSAADMRRHIRSHENIKPYQCTQCPANFFTKAHLERHRTVHMKDRPFSCEKCGNTFKDEESLRKHGLSFHDKIRRHRCDFCSKNFFKSSLFKRHLRVHTGEKPFTCKFCEMSYAQNADLLRHLRRAHVGDSIYNCTIEGCTESFRLKSELVDHYKVHYQNKAEKNKKEIDFQ